MDRTETYRGESYRGTTTRRSRIAKDAEMWTSNFVAMALAMAALALFVVGMLEGTGVIGGDDPNNIQDGSLWLFGAIALAITANVFRREHHIVTTDEEAAR